MQYRLADVWTTVTPLFAAMIVASCATEPGTGTRLATLTAVSGSGQFAPAASTLPQPLVVRVEDQFGAPVAGETIEWRVTAGGGIVTPSQSVTDVAGLATATLRLGNTPGVNTVAASLQQLQTVIFSATATPALPANLVVVAGANQTAPVGTQLPVDLVVRVTDAVGGPKAGVAVAFAIGSGGGSLSTASVVSAADGNATVKWTLGTISGPQTVLVSASGITAITIGANAVAGAADALTIVSGNNQTGTPGTPLPDSLRVRLTDRFGNPISGVTITWTPGAGHGTVNPATSATDVTGQAATRWTLGSTGGPKTVTASGGGFSRVFSGGGNITYTILSAGSRHSCGLASGGVAYCWGYNGDGQLGSGSTVSLPQPSGTAGGLTFAEILAGGFHSCALTLAGVGYCWGNNVDGRLGSPGGSATSPTQVSGGMTFGRIDPGNLHTCGLDLAGRAFCWGANVDGQLGDASNTNRTAPAAVSGGKFYSAISAGGLHSCAIDLSNRTWCWGNNSTGQLGNNTTAPSNAPVALIGGLSMSVISAGYLHSCGITVAGVAYCWGNNQNGQLGDGTTDTESLPTVVAGGLTFSGISAGMSHSCGVTTTGSLYCWGGNTNGQLGDATTTGRTAPGLVAGGLVFRSVSAGEAHTCGVTTSNVAYCWGDNQFGQLGDGTLVSRFTPAKVAFQP